MIHARYVKVSDNGINFDLSVESAESFLKAVQLLKAAGKESTEVYADGEPTGETLDTDCDHRAIALASHLGCSPLDVEECRYGDNQYESTENAGEYLVLTDSEADTAWNEQLENYIDECILIDVPDGMQTLAQYFDREAWKRDACHDGRGHSLSSYDGEENEEKIDGVWYYIYRVN